jgi:hypothetical protein
MNPNQRFSILTFPQFFDGAQLAVNIVVLPRDQNPLSNAIVQHPTIADAVPFADAQLSFTASIFDSLAVFPHNHAPISGLPLVIDAPLAPPTSPRAIYSALAPQLNIVNLNTTNSNADLAALGADFKPPAARPTALTVKKYLPESYRGAFHFTSPRHENLVTDDSYHCAVKDGQLVPGFKRSSDVVSWGKVFAYLMRQPLLATLAGLIYRAHFAVQAAHFPNGGWLYVDLAPQSDYRPQLDTDHTFIRRYAARIPTLIPGQPRQVFASVLFPVLFKAQPVDPDPASAGNYDQLFIEAAEYDDGFTKIVHCRQPPNRDRLEEKPDGAYPVKEVGVELGFDDEAITERYIRQMEANPAGDMDGRIDAPIGVFGYAVDVRETAEPENPWEPLNHVESRQPLILPDPADPANPIQLGQFVGELPYQVYPMQLDGRQHLNYWLPMYFANWIGHSMILPDPDAAAIYQTTNVDVLADPLDTVNDTGTGTSGPAQNQLNQIYQASVINTQLRYGGNYEFRVRMLDLSGGGPARERSPVNESPSDVTSCRFRRFISPNQPRIQEMEASGNDDSILVNSDQATPIAALNFRRPKLGYPAVVFTGKYADPVQRLIEQANLGLQVDNQNPNLNAEHRVGLGIADPDVDRLEITVEIATPKLDKLDSVSGKDDYVHLYTTTRAFPNVNQDDDYEAVLNIPIEYRDVKVLHTGDAVDLVNDLNLAADIDDLPQLVLPTGRTARLTVRAVCEEKDDNEAHYGVIDPANKLLDNRFGETFEIVAYAPSADETDLLVQTPGVPSLQGIFMQPDVVTAVDGKLATLLLGKKSNDQRDNVQQLADRLHLNASKLTVSAPKGERILFGCSSRIRHTLAPDGASVTFASKGDLINHWLCCISFAVDRDWMWDALQHRGFVIRRTKRYSRDAQPEETNVIAGDIEVVRTASFDALDQPRRDASRIVFIDAVEPKKAAPGNGGAPDFPDTIELTYTLDVHFKPEHGQQADPPVPLELRLPITTPPVQVPRIVSAGIALSPYVRNERYSASEARKRHLWIEFDEPVKDPQDTLFARVLAVAPDQLLSNNDPELLAAPEEPVLPIDPEYIRVVTPGATNDLAGLRAMQPMEKSTSSDRHYLLPLPPGLHAEADEMFGFFTYEFRLGHYRDPNSGEMVWTTAQGRYGRRLRVTGIQHPAPTLTCMPNRDDEKLWVSAPYAVAVHEGKNVTADPPRTELWALLYAQVKQADNRDYRNILLDDRPLDWRIQVETKKDVKILEKHTDDQLQVLRSVAFRNFKYEISAASFTNYLKLVDFSTKNKDATRYGTAIWTQNEVTQLLRNLGLPLASPLSVLVVETLPHITKLREHISRLDKPRTVEAAESLVADVQAFRRDIDASAALLSRAVIVESPSPVSDELGQHRILRTSPLTEVPEICPPI